jgi:hypothetical protein
MPNAVLLDNAVNLMFEIYLLRGDCSAAARALAARGRNEEAIEDCAKLDDTLAKTFRALQKTLRCIQRSRARRSHPQC